MAGTYTYDPAKLRDADGKMVYGLDLMRFELGDTMVEGKEDTCALCDEEYVAMIPTRIQTKRSWKKAKLKCLESIVHRFAYEPDTKDGPVSWSFGERAKLWKTMYDALKKELAATGASGAAIEKLVQNPQIGEITPPYFYNGMMSHEEAEGQDI